MTAYEGILSHIFVFYDYNQFLSPNLHTAKQVSETATRGVL